MPGYSGTPLPKKLGIKDGFRIAVCNLPEDVKAELDDALAKCQISRERLDFAMLFAKSRNELEKQFPRFSELLAPAGML